MVFWEKDGKKRGKKGEILKKKLLSFALSFLIVNGLFLSYLYFSVPFSAQAQSSEWLSGWQYRKSIPISYAAGAGSGYQIEVTVDYDSNSLVPEIRTEFFKSSGWDSYGRLFIQKGEVSGSDTLYWSLDNGDTFTQRWIVPDGGKFYRTTLFIDSQDRIFVSAVGHTSGSPNRVYRSTDGGQTFWQVLDHAFWNMDEDADGNLYGGRYPDNPDVFKSTDGGLSWEIISDSSWYGPSYHIHNVRIDPSTGWLYAAVGEGPVGYDKGGLWRSKLKDGSDWVFKYGSPDGKLPPVGIAFDGSDIYLAMEIDALGVYKFQDDGTDTFQAMSDSQRVLYDPETQNLPPKC